MLRAGQVEGGPGTPGQDNAVDINLVLDAELQVVVRLANRTPSQGSKGAFRRVHVPLARGFAEEFMPGRSFGNTASVTGCSTSFLRPPHSWMRRVLR